MSVNIANHLVISRLASVYVRLSFMLHFQLTHMMPDNHIEANLKLTSPLPSPLAKVPPDLAVLSLSTIVKYGLANFLPSLFFFWKISFWGGRKHRLIVCVAT